MKDLEYDEFEVVLERSGDGYSARVADSPTGPAPAMPFVQPMEIADLPPHREHSPPPPEGGSSTTTRSPDTTTSPPTG